MKIHFKTKKIEQIFLKYDISPENSDVLYTRVDIFFAFFFEKTSGGFQKDVVRRKFRKYVGRCRGDRKVHQIT